MYFLASEVKELLDEYFKYHTMAEVARRTDSPEALSRRLYAVRSGKIQFVSLQVLDVVSQACDHPHWIHDLEPVKFNPRLYRKEVNK